MSWNEPNQDADDDWEAWGEARRCIGCGTAIPSERLEILPNTQQCTPCAASGRTSREDQREFCDRCGGLLTLTQRRGTGLAGYRMICTHCGR
jgi:predicted nucleic acid-binding Zn ribbon protein